MAKTKHIRCAWPRPCDEPGTNRRPGSMLDYCDKHAIEVHENREAMFEPIEKPKRKLKAVR